MKKKTKNGWNILILTITNLEKYVYSKKCLKNDVDPLPPAKSKTLSRRKSHLATAVILGRPAPFPNKFSNWLGKQ